MARKNPKTKTKIIHRFFYYYFCCLNIVAIIIIVNRKLWMIIFYCNHNIHISHSVCMYACMCECGQFILHQMWAFYHYYISFFHHHHQNMIMNQKRKKNKINLYYLRLWVVDLICIQIKSNFGCFSLVFHYRLRLRWWWWWQSNFGLSYQWCVYDDQTQESM